MKKNKFIDKCKSWLLTLGVASVFGLAALGVNAAKSYEKASAYEYQENGDLVFSWYNYDFEILRSYIVLNGHAPDETHSMYYIHTAYILFDDSENVFEFDTILADEYYLNFQDSLLDEYIAIDVVTLNVDESQGITTPFSITFNTNSLIYYSLLNYTLSFNAPQQSGNFITALTSFMSLLGGAIVQLATPVASGVTSFASALFIDNSHLSIMGGIIGIFAGIALAVGITSKVYAWVSTLGN